MDGILVLIGAGLFALGFWMGYGWRKPSHQAPTLLKAIEDFERESVFPARRIVSFPARWEEDE